jgi:hypothetical protein
MGVDYYNCSECNVIFADCGECYFCSKCDDKFCYKCKSKVFIIEASCDGHCMVDTIRIIDSDKCICHDTIKEMREQCVQVVCSNCMSIDVDDYPDEDDSFIKFLLLKANFESIDDAITDFRLTGETGETGETRETE